jgi:uncharacterized delta-60 repeat protein
MRFFSSTKFGSRLSRVPRSSAHRRPQTVRPQLETLEDRALPSSGLILATAVTQVTSGYDQINGLAVQTDGKILAAGDGLVRYNSNLTLDTSFANGGIQNTPFNAAGIALQPADGKSVLAGVTSVFYPTKGASGGGYHDDNFAVGRFTTSGALDTTFGGGKGYVITDVSKGNFTFSGKKNANPSANNEAAAVAIDSSGRIVVAGRASDFNDIYGESGDDAFVIARYTSTGALDTTFNSGGRMPGTVVSWPSTTGWNSLSSVVIQADGKIVVGGNVGCCGNAELALERYNTNGTLDTSFGNGGIVVQSIAPGAHIALDAAGNIVVASNANPSAGRGVLLARFTPTGALDTTFGGTGYVITSLSSPYGSGGSGNAVAINPSNGKIAVGGHVDGNIDEFAVLQYNPDGTLDTTFNGTGTLVFGLPGTNDHAHAVAYDPSGNIIGGGNDGGSGNKANFAIALIDPPSGAAPSTATTTGSASGSSGSDSTILFQPANIGSISNGATSTAPGNGSVTPAAAGLSGGASQGGIWSFVPPAEATSHHLPFESASSGAGSLWADQIVDASFSDFANGLLAIGL